MPNLIVYDDDVINAVQPEVSAVKVGVLHSMLVDANLSQYTTTLAGRYTCCDVNGLTLWALQESDISQLFVDAGASGLLEPSSWGQESIWLNEAGDKMVVWAIGTFGSARYKYVGIADISAVGAVGAPILINYLRMKLNAVNLYDAVGVWERRDSGAPGSLVVMTRDFTTDKVQWHSCPSVADVEAGTYRGAHPNCTGVLASDQGPGVTRAWTSSTAFRVGYTGSSFHDGSVVDNPLGFMANNKFYFVVPKGWMENSGNGFGANWVTARPDGGVFEVGSASVDYVNAGWPFLAVELSTSLTSDATDVTDTIFTPALPWTEEYTRIYDGVASTDWEPTYNGRPAVFYPADGLPVILFGVIDGDETYADDIGAGERIFYAKVRGYKWTGAAFALFDAASGIVLRDGDLGYSNYDFDTPDSQNIFLIDGDIYLQICQTIGSTTTQRSVLTRFGRFVESETRQTQACGRVRYVART